MKFIDLVGAKHRTPKRESRIDNRNKDSRRARLCSLVRLYHRNRMDIPFGAGRQICDEQRGSGSAER